MFLDCPLTSNFKWLRTKKTEEELFFFVLNFFLFNFLKFFLFVLSYFFHSVFSFLFHSLYLFLPSFLFFCHFFLLIFAALIFCSQIKILLSKAFQQKELKRHYIRNPNLYFWSEPNCYLQDAQKSQVSANFNLCCFYITK